MSSQQSGGCCGIGYGRPMIGGLVLAAGGSSRFGEPKQLAVLDGRPLLEHVLIAMSDAGLDRVVAVLGANAPKIAAGVPLHGAEVVVCEQWAEGLAASLRAGVAALDGCDAVAVALGDQPRLSAAAIERVVSQRGADELAVRATYAGVPGHPVLLERTLLSRVPGLRGDSGARELLNGVPIREVACDGLGSPADVDTPEALAALRSPAV
jgi:molybdenum cofactor cytidylyltransferase